MRNSTIILLVLYPIFSFAQSTGKISNGSGKDKIEFTLNLIKNPYSETLEILTDGILEESTDFTLNNEGLEKLILKVKGQKYPFFVEPGGSYSLTIDGLNPLIVSLKEEKSSVNSSLMKGLLN